MCSRPREFLRFLLGDGTLVPVPCNCPNLCEACAWMGALIAAAMVGLDARESDVPPTIGFTVTTQAATTSPAVFRRDVEQAFRFLRHPTRLGRELEYLGFIEHTTGNGTRSGGFRRIHQHGLGKCEREFRVGELLGLEDDFSGFWHGRTGAHRVELRELRSAAGATAYLTLHHHKKGQRPPQGWRGRRLRPSKGYWSLPAGELRETAKTIVRDKRRLAALQAAINFEALSDLQGEAAAEQLLADALERVEAQGPAQLVRVARVPTGWVDGVPTVFEEVVVEVMSGAGGTVRR